MLCDNLRLGDTGGIRTFMKSNFYDLWHKIDKYADYKTNVFDKNSDPSLEKPHKTLIKQEMYLRILYALEKKKNESNNDLTDAQFLQCLSEDDNYLHLFFPDELKYMKNINRIGGKSRHHRHPSKSLKKKRRTLRKRA